MRYSKMLLPTLRETPSEAEVISHQFMLRAGMIRKVAAGIYDVLPMGLRVLRKVETIVREEMNRAGAQEVLMPIVQPAELWQESGRWHQYGPELLRITDRHGREFCFGPTAEEVITNIVRRDVSSYRQLPLNLYQIHTKFRDEIRPRFGLMRGREFIMKDAYSFDADEPGAEASYEAMRQAYHRIFQRCGLKFRAVEADSGNIGGSFSSEFMVLADTGEDAIASCDKSRYAANVEKAAARAPEPVEPPATLAPLTMVDTPARKSIQEVSDFLNVPAEQTIKTLIYQADNEVVAALVRGDDEINEIKLKNHLGAGVLFLADDKTTEKVTNAPLGFAGPVGLKDVRILADLRVRYVFDAVVGANSADAHYTGANLDRDYRVDEFVDLRLVRAGDPSPGDPEGVLRVDRGIEVGHIFKLGTKYSEAMGCTVLNDQGEELPVIMGCYGIGIGRTAAAAIEQNHDDGGIIWPMPIAPYQVLLVTLNAKDEVLEYADKLYDDLIAAGVEVLYDDRDERAGVKFNDADLLGVPLRLTVGKKGLAEGIVELKQRRIPGKDFEKVATDKLIERVRELIDEGMGTGVEA
ncbi:MAG: proline--tRNA ligase [Deltaproteobacteria bacterium]|nr:proline--tRNA ligase [Deltaproteobacteria bacterium]MCB9487747.1 proline--tRNA ligase [Deltaproteobacteria bacterium]